MKSTHAYCEMVKKTTKNPTKPVHRHDMPYHRLYIYIMCYSFLTFFCLNILSCLVGLGFLD